MSGKVAMRTNSTYPVFSNGNKPPHGTVFLVDPSMVERDPKQPRHRFRKKALTELALSIRTVGQLKPIEVRWLDGDGPIRYHIVDGERRWLAIQDPTAQTSHVKAILSESTGEIGGIEDFLRSVVANFCAERHTITEIALACGRLRDEAKRPNGKPFRHHHIAHATGLSIPSVRNFLALLRLHDDLFRRLDPETPKNQRLKMVAGLALVKLNHEAQLEVAAKLGPNITNPKKVTLAVAVKLGLSPESRHPDSTSRAYRQADHVQLLRRVVGALGRNLNDLDGVTGNDTLKLITPAQLEELKLEIKGILQKTRELHRKLCS